MNRTVTAGVFLVCASAAVPGVAHAEVSGSMKLTSHYAFQGGSESDENPAVQGSLQYTLEPCHVGFWASGADYDGHVEIDYEAGCGGSLSETLGYGVDLVYLTYPGHTHENLVEARFTLSAELGQVGVRFRLGLPKWSDYSGATNTSGHYRPQFGINVPLGDAIGAGVPLEFSATVGRDGKRRDCDDYDWYHAELGTSVRGLGLSVFWSDRGDRDPRCSDGVVTTADGILGVAISRSF